MIGITELLKKDGPLTANEIMERLGHDPKIRKQIADAKKKSRETGMRDLPRWSEKNKRYVSLYYLEEQLQKAAEKAGFVPIEEKDEIKVKRETPRELSLKIRRYVNRIIDVVTREEYGDDFKEKMANHLFSLTQSSYIEDNPRLLELYKKIVEEKVTSNSKAHLERILAALHNSLRRILDNEELREWFLKHLYDEICKQARDKDLTEDVRIERLRNLEDIYKSNLEDKKTEIRKIFIDVCLDEETRHDSQLFKENKHRIISMAEGAELEKLIEKLFKLAKQENPEDTRRKAQELLEIYIQSTHFREVAGE